MELEAGKPDGPILAENATKYFVNKGINELKEKFTTSAGSGITLTNGEIKYYYKSNKNFRKLKNFIKRNYWKNYSTRRRITQFFCSINESCCTINENCTYIIV